MTTNATIRKVKKSFTLTPEALAFLDETRQKRGLRSDSEALELLLREAKLREIDAAYKDYYDTASDKELAEEREWAEMVGPNTIAMVPE